MKNLFYTAIYILLSGLFLFTGCAKKTVSDEVTGPVAVKTTEIIQADLNNSIHTSGMLRSGDESQLSFKTGGIIKAIHAKEGDSVKKGQLLAELHPDEIQAMLDQAENAFAKSERDLQRVKKLYQDNGASLQQFQDAETGYNVNKANLDMARFNYTRSKIIAPATGKILSRVKEENEMVSAGMPIFLFASTDKSWLVRASVTDKQIVKVQQGDSASITFDAYPGVVYKGLVSLLSQYSNPMTGLFDIKVTLQTSPRNLVNGLTAKMDVFPAARLTGLFIPVEAIVAAEGANGYVFIVTPDNKAQKTPVMIIAIENKGVAVTGSFTAGQKVVTTGAPYLKDGDSIKIIETSIAAGGNE